MASTRDGTEEQENELVSPKRRCEGRWLLERKRVPAGLVFERVDSWMEVLSSTAMEGTCWMVSLVALVVFAFCFRLVADSSLFWPYSSSEASEGKESCSCTPGNILSVHHRVHGVDVRSQHPNGRARLPFPSSLPQLPYFTLVAPEVSTYHFPPLPQGQTVNPPPSLDLLPSSVQVLSPSRSSKGSSTSFTRSSQSFHSHSSPQSPPRTHWNLLPDPGLNRTSSLSDRRGRIRFPTRIKTSSTFGLSTRPRLPLERTHFYFYPFLSYSHSSSHLRLVPALLSSS